MNGRRVNIPSYRIKTTDIIEIKDKSRGLEIVLRGTESSERDIPEYIEVDMAEVDLGQTVHLSDIKLPKGVESVALSYGDDHDLPVAAVNKPKAVEEISDEAPEAPETEDDSAEEASEE